MENQNGQRKARAEKIFSMSRVEHDSKDVLGFIKSQSLNPMEASVVKLVCRHRTNNGLSDVKLARQIINRIIVGYYKNE